MVGFDVVTKGDFGAGFQKVSEVLGERFAGKIDHNFRFSWRSSLRMGSESRGNCW